jgi:hypothetical protein
MPKGKEEHKATLAQALMTAEMLLEVKGKQFR